MDEPHAATREEQPQQQSLERIRDVLTIISGPHITGERRSACDIYAKEARTPPQIHVLRTKEHPTKNAQRELEDIVFIKADTRWVHYTHVDALIIIARVANSNVHRLLVDDGSAINITYFDAYKRIGLTESESPLYGFAEDHMMP